jgi:hypothetical protein
MARRSSPHGEIGFRVDCRPGESSRRRDRAQKLAASERRMMTIATTALLVGLAAQPAWAVEMALTKTMRCGDAATLVARDGAVVLSSAPQVYDRYVRGVDLCLKPEFIERATVPTIDSARCVIGYRCNTEGPRNGAGTGSPQQ